MEGERDEETGKFIMPVDNAGEADEAVYNGSTSYARMMPSQKVYHYKAVTDNTFFIGSGQLKANIAYQQNVRKEFEDVTEPDEAELHMALHTVNYNIHYLTAELQGWRIASGVNGMWQANRNKGEEFLVPDYNLFDFGLFATANKTFGQWSVSGGLRFDNRHLHAKPLTEEGEERFTDFTKNFSGFTGSIGAIYNISENANLRMNLARGFRAPNISELASNGEHEGTLRYEVGNHNLKAAFMGHAHNNDWTVEYMGMTIGLGVKTGPELYYAHIDVNSEDKAMKSGLSSVGIDENFDLIGASLVTLTDEVGSFDLEHLYLNERASDDFVRWVKW